MTVGVQPDHWLEQRSSKLVTQRKQPDLRETEMERALEQRVDGNDQ